MSIIRLYLKTEIIAGKTISLDKDKYHYLKNVMRLKDGDRLKVFNKDYGEWLALFYNTKIKVESMLRNVDGLSLKKDIIMAVSPIKWKHFHTMLTQMTEIGVNIIQPIITRYTMKNYLFNKEKIERTLIEATEQSDRLVVPEFREYVNFDDIFTKYSDYSTIICNENRNGINPLEVFSKINKAIIIIGPEGGFTEQELNNKFSYNIKLCNNILRSETAATVALSAYMLCNIA